MLTLVITQSGFSELVGETGRVIAFEPVPVTFSLLSSNCQLFAYKNVSLINAAVSTNIDIVGMNMPNFPTGLANYSQANITPSQKGLFSVLTVSLDFLCENHPINLVKIDVEGHEKFVLAGMKKTY